LDSADPNATYKMNSDIKDKQGEWVVPTAIADQIIAKTARELFCAFWTGPKNAHIYALSGGGARRSPVIFEKKRPLQAHHPAYYFKTARYLNPFHITDLHVSMRQQLLSRSKARVIDYSQMVGGDKIEKDLDVSPYLGDKIVVTGKHIADLLTAAGTDPAVDLVCFTGDLIDYIRNVYLPPEMASKELSPKEIWDHVALTDDFESRYEKFIDFIAFYELVTNFCAQYGKPIVVVSGNHDCYREPYGLSPRVTAAGVEVTMANEGVPADHNLTLYEAMLIFGPTYHEIKKASATSNFDKEQFRWLYNVMTPFASFGYSLAKQNIVGLGWGNDEDLLGDSPFSAHGFGHLPRSPESISDAQLELIKRLFLKNDRKNILLTHFTFASYKDGLPLIPSDGKSTYTEGVIDTSYSGSASVHTSDFDLGTFHKNRKAVYNDFIVGTGEGAARQQIHLVLSGHSHRRGLYTVVQHDKNWVRSNKIHTRFLDFHDYPTIKGTDEARCLMIVSDSAGPLPRYNHYGEFDGWGSDRASGTKVTFDQASGQIDKLEAIKVGPKPRLVVALDYLDLIPKDSKVFRRKVISEIVSEPITSKAVRRGKGSVGVAFKLFESDSCTLERAVIGIGNQMKLYYLSAGESGYISLDIVGNGQGAVNAQEIAGALKLNTDAEKLQWFMAIRFNVSPQTKLGASLLSRYDCGDWWCFECTLKIDEKIFSLSKEKILTIERDGNAALSMNFTSRKKDPKYA
ncbi:MAG: metallophosphoesterase, partial [Gammaproteobacteria bacterium]|nr:metallophosphoesterase [Gammaproteobacteria bacterium]